MRTVLHVDMDAFFASVEQRDDPALLGKPVLVGGRSRRGVVAAASYEARRHGARSAMPMAEALRRCPDAIVVPPRHARYAEVSAQVFDVFHRFTPEVEGLSLDEAFLDVTASARLFGDGARVARRIQAAIADELGLTASAGVAPCKFVAKIASDLKKPAGLVVVRPDEVAAFLAPLPVERMWGIGPRTAPRVRDAGLRTLGDVARAPQRRLVELFGRAGPFLQALARGEDDRPVVPGRAAVSLGAEETFEEDLVRRDALERRLLAQSSRVARRLRRTGRSGRIVVLKVKLADFRVLTRRVTLAEPIDDTDSIYEAARALLTRMPLEGRGVRLTGVAVAGLLPGAPPARLLPDPAMERRRKLEEVVGKVTERFGERGVLRAALLEDEEEERG